MHMTVKNILYKGYQLLELQKYLIFHISARANPFEMRVVFDDNELIDAIAANQAASKASFNEHQGQPAGIIGFSLDYFQGSTGC